MITPPERSDARDAAIDAMLPLVPEYGWSLSALRRAVGATGERLFANGAADMVETYIDLMDRRMAETAAPLLPPLRLHQRVRMLVATRLALAHPHRAAVRRAAAVLALPGNALLSARCTARTVDAIWASAGDVSADFSWYTKRAILAGVYSSTLLYWLNDSTTEEAALEFLDRRLAGVARIGKWRARLSGARLSDARAA
jgi:ubiquinone biosynthesis protein COQ9